MTDITLETTARSTFRTALRGVGCRLAMVFVRLWDGAARHAERPGRYVPYC